MSPTEEARRLREQRLRLQLRGVTILVMIVLVAVAFQFYNVAERNELARKTDAIQTQAQQDAATAINVSACTFRKLFTESLQRSRAAAADPDANPGTRQRNKEAIPFYRQLLAATVTVPRSFPCEEFLAGLVRKQRAREETP